jgi:hypothetical protein
MSSVRKIIIPASIHRWWLREHQLLVFGLDSWNMMVQESLSQRQPPPPNRHSCTELDKLYHFLTLISALYLDLFIETK